LRIMRRMHAPGNRNCRIPQPLARPRVWGLYEPAWLKQDGAR
jgi:hypothetical protein